MKNKSLNLKTRTLLKKAVSLVMAAVMVITILPLQPITAYAQEQGTTVCTHHTHDENCGYAEAVEGVSCTWTAENCAECNSADDEAPADEEAAVDEEIPADEIITAKPVVECICGTDDETIHAANCPLYTPVENPQCFCVEKCTEATLNYWCDVCGIQGAAACQATEEETATMYNSLTYPCRIDPSNMTNSNGMAFVAGGTHLYIDDGTTSGNTVIYYIKNGTKIYINQNGADGEDLSEASIYGGHYSANALTSDTYITIYGGKVNTIYGGNFHYNGTSYETSVSGALNGNVNITINGGTVSGVYGGINGKINGDVNINVTDGTIDTVFVPARYPGFPVSGNATVNISGGNINRVVGEMSNYSVNGTLNGYVTSGEITTAGDTQDQLIFFQNLLYRNGNSWTIKGSPVVPTDVTMTVNSGETVNIGENNTIINNGVINNSGTINMYGTVTGNSITGNGTVNRYAAYIAGISSVSGLSAYIDGAEQSGYHYELASDGLYLWLPSGKAKVTVNGTSYYGIAEKGKKTQLVAYNGAQEISGMPESIGANCEVELTAAVSTDILKPEINYTVIDSGTTASGAKITGNKLYAANAGNVKIKVTVDETYFKTEKEFDITVNYIPIQNISSLQTQALINQNITLPTALPDTASYKDIVWTVVSGSAIIENGILTPTATGELTVKASVENGKVYGEAYTQTFTIQVSSVQDTTLDISASDIIIEKNDENTLKITYDGYTDGYKIIDKNLPVTITGTTTQYVVRVKSGTANIILENCNITFSPEDGSERQAIRIDSGATANITLSGSNKLTYVLTPDSGVINTPLYVSSGATVVIDGDGTLEATGGPNSGCIGSTYYLDAGTVIINNGTIKLHGTNGGAGFSIIEGKLIINGGTITSDNTNYGILADNSDISIKGGNITMDSLRYGITAENKTAITIDAGNVTLNSGTAISGSSEASITLEINGGYVELNGVGADSLGIFECDKVTINGGTVTVAGSYNSIRAVNMSISGGTVKTVGSISGTISDNRTLSAIALDAAASSTEVTAIAGVEYGINDVKTLDTNKLYFYLPNNAKITSITAGGKEYICYDSDLTYYTSHIFDKEKADGVCTRCGQNCQHTNQTGASCTDCGMTLHIHSWKYTVDESTYTITANCTAADCPNTNGGSVKITVADREYNGNAVEADIANSLITGDTYTVSYTAKAGSALTADKAVNAGEYTAILALGGESVSADFKITAKEITADMVNISGDGLSYDGNAKTPAVTVTANGNTLAETTDYTVEYENNIKATTDTSKATVTVKGTGNYKGTVSLDFDISKSEPTADLFVFTPPADNLTYNGSAKTATVKVNNGVVGMGNVTVLYQKDGVNLTEAVNAGEYKVVISIQEGDNYTVYQGHLTSSDWKFTIEKADYDMSNVKWNRTSSEPFEFDGTEHTVELTGLPQGVTASYTENSKTAVGGYVAKAELNYDSENYNTPDAISPLSWKIEWNATENKDYTINSTVAPNSDGWYSSQIQIIPKNGYKLKTSEDNQYTDIITLTEDTAEGRVRFRAYDPITDSLSYGKTLTYKLDTTVPTGTVTVEENSWTAFLNSITFDKFFNKTVDVKVNATDTTSGVKSVEYIESIKALKLDELKQIANWTAMGTDNKVSVTAEDAKQFVYYIRITDNADNMTIISSDGMVFDLTPPVISDITNGATYYTTQKFTVTEANLADVKVNDNAVTDCTLAGNVDATYKAVATDKAGNSAIITVTMKPISALTENIKDLTEADVTGDDTDAIKAAEEAITAVDTTNATQAEKDEIAEAQENIDRLQQVVEDTAAEVKALEDTLAGYDKDTVKSTDEAAVDQLIADLTAKLEDTNLSAEQKADLTEALADAQALAQQIDSDKAALEDANNSVPAVDTDNVTADNAEDLAAAKDKLEGIVDNDNYTEEQQKDAQEQIDKIEELEKVIEETGTSVDKAVAEEGYADKTQTDITSAEKDAIEANLETVEKLLDTDNLTEEQRKALEDTKTEAEKLIAEIKENSEALDNALKAEKDTTEDNYQLSDKEDLKEAVENLKAVTDENNKNYTAEEKQTAQAEINRIEAIIADIEETETVIADITNAVEKVVAITDVKAIPDSEEAVDAVIAAQDDYNELTDRQKELVGDTLKQNINDSLAKITAYEIIHGADGKWTKGSSKTLGFTANGLFKLFKEVRVDGNVLVKDTDYTAMSGSTIVTLSKSYLDTLSVGKHKLEVVYDVLGEEHIADCEFTIKAKPAPATQATPAPTDNVPKTGDSTNAVGWMILMLSSIAALAVVFKKKKEYEDR